MFLSLAAAILFSFHNTAWPNISAQLPLTLKRRLFHHRFSETYSRCSKLSNKLRLILIHLYFFYFGVLQALGKVKHRETQMSVLDLGLTSMAHMLLLLLALNFQWSSRAVRKKNLDREVKDADGQE